VRFATVPVVIVDGPTDVQVLLENLGTGEQHRERARRCCAPSGRRSIPDRGRHWLGGTSLCATMRAC
jgi:hypothetical protein